MKAKTLKIYSIIVTGVAAAALAALAMWTLTNCDMITIWVAIGIIAFITAGMAAAEDELEGFLRYRRIRRAKEKPLYIYDIRKSS